MRDTPTKSASILMGTRFSPRNSGSYRNRRSARTISASVRRPGTGGKAWRWLRTARGVALPPSDGARSYTQNNGELDDGEVGELGRPIREQTLASSNRSEAIKFTSSAIARMPEPQPRRPTTSHKKRARVLGKADMTADIPKAPLLT